MNRAGKTEHFNFPKWHIMSHYPDWKKFYGSATGFTTGIEDSMYITWIKDFFKWTNMSKGYEKHILDYNVEKFSLVVRANLHMFASTKTLTQVNQNAKLQVNLVSGAKKIMEDVKWHSGKDEH